ncbi:hypothetical protein COT60_02000 [Candidatus Pacearchaeota archaeon CG09_land_8_20_14_0_10_30_9]|nr:MAG: hypothetical protein AUJ61_02040 [Candidatus Pacearchaeota archaeon CG1_02_30_18]PIN71761.1 MAG: hypothetical protein COV77_00295 [Candidatus Pacearchaeota archaeon CG11_big_fil_rev_8_21_14_0_20_30_13]PIO01147.1 MAG: hypothetical protein COT60_02000 [Candidatus Pacearchaeota archaeon CG09_land_8_20_14_0_10_30_9]
MVKKEMLKNKKIIGKIQILFGFLIVLAGIVGIFSLGELQEDYLLLLKMNGIGITLALVIIGQGISNLNKTNKK